MLAWLEGVAGSAYATAMMWTLGALLLLVVILLLIKVVRSLSFGTFVIGGRNRKTRLAVMDAAAVDSHRRLVLVRRDDVEHLILIGGPTDVVVEQNIRLAPALRRAASDESPTPREVRLPPDAQHMSPAPAPAVQPAAARAEPVVPAPDSVKPSVPARVETAQQPRPTAPPSTPAVPAAAARPVHAPSPAAVPLRPIAPAAAAVPAARAAAAPAPIAPPIAVNDQPPSLDDALLDELEVTLGRNAAVQPAPVDQPGLPSSVEDEMSKLLGDLARPRR